MKKLTTLLLLIIVQNTIHAQLHGCMDPAAHNYNPEAIFNTGDCCYSKFITLHSDQHLFINLYSGNNYLGYYEFPNTYEFCLNSQCIKINGSGFLSTEASASLTVTFNNELLGEYVFQEYWATEYFIPFDENNTGICNDPQACNYTFVGSCVDNTTCIYTCTGCMDSEAINYNSLATISTNNCCYNTDYLYTIEADGPLNLDIYATATSPYVSYSYPAVTQFCYDSPCIEFYARSDNYDPVNFTIYKPNGDILYQGTTVLEILYHNPMVSAAIPITGTFGCSNPIACNYNPDETCLTNSICDFSCGGCTDPEAINFDPDATIDNNNCCYDEFHSFITTNVDCYIAIYSTSFDQVNSTYIVSSEANIPKEICLSDGCFEIIASSFDPQELILSLTRGSQTIFDQITENSTHLHAFFDINGIAGCMEEGASNYDPQATCTNYYTECIYEDSGCLNPSALNYAPYATTASGHCCMDEFEFFLSGNNPFVSIMDSQGNWIFPITFDEETNKLCVVDGCNTIHISNTTPNSVFLCYDVNGELYYQGVTDNSGEASFAYSMASNEGCMDISACNYDPESNCHNEEMCYHGCHGCMDPAALNYNSEAYIDDAYCCYGENYTIAFENLPNGTFIQIELSYSNNDHLTQYSLVFPQENTFCAPPGCFYMNIGVTWTPQNFTIYDPSGNVFYEGQTDGENSILIELNQGVTSGCMDPNACNFSSLATCELPNTCNYDCYGCTDPSAPNFNPSSTMDDGSCCANNWYSVICSIPLTGTTTNNDTFNIQEPQGFCLDSECIGIELNNPEGAPFNVSIISPEGIAIFEGSSDINGNVIIPYSSSAQITGCTDPQACNYNPLATCSIPICEFIEYGCTDPTAFNYVPCAIWEDGSCIYNVNFPTVEFDVFDLNDDQELYVNTIITDLGDVSPLQITNDYNAAIKYVFEPNEYLMGPYPCDQTVTVFVSSALYPYADPMQSNPAFAACTIDFVNGADQREFRIYPNPSNGQFTLTGMADGNYQIQVTDLTGRMVYTSRITSTNGRIEMDLSNIAVGQYQVTLINEIEMQTTKILIQH